MIIAELMAKLYSPSQLIWLTLFLLFLTVLVSLHRTMGLASMAFPFIGIIAMLYLGFIADHTYFDAIRKEFGSSYFYYLFAPGYIPIIYLLINTLIKKKTSNKVVDPIR